MRSDNHQKEIERARTNGKSVRDGVLLKRGFGVTD
jgi:hypothetical protein